MGHTHAFVYSMLFFVHNFVELEASVALHQASLRRLLTSKQFHSHCVDENTEPWQWIEEQSCPEESLKTNGMLYYRIYANPADDDESVMLMDLRSPYNLECSGGACENDNDEEHGYDVFLGSACLPVEGNSNAGENTLNTFAEGPMAGTQINSKQVYIPITETSTYILGLKPRDSNTFGKSLSCTYKMSLGTLYSDDDAASCSSLVQMTTDNINNLGLEQCTEDWGAAFGGGYVDIDAQTVSGRTAWAIPVGITLGLLAIGGGVFGVYWYKTQQRKTKLSRGKSIRRIEKYRKNLQLKNQLEESSEPKLDVKEPEEAYRETKLSEEEFKNLAVDVQDVRVQGQPSPNSQPPPINSPNPITPTEGADEDILDQAAVEVKEAEKANEKLEHQAELERERERETIEEKLEERKKTNIE